MLPKVGRIRWFKSGYGIQTLRFESGRPRKAWDKWFKRDYIKIWYRFPDGAVRVVDRALTYKAARENIKRRLSLMERRD